VADYQAHLDSVSAKLIDGAREHEELLVLRDRSALLEKEVSESLYQTEARQREWADKLNSVRREMDGLALENKDLQGDVLMLHRQVERYKNSLNEVEIIMQKYDALGQKEHEMNLRGILGDIKQEVENVQKEVEEVESPPAKKDKRIKAPPTDVVIEDPLP